MSMDARKSDRRSALQMRKATEETRKRDAKRLWESDDVTIQSIGRRTKTDHATLKRWAAEGGWKRGCL
jgi:hypothetical protein